MTIIGSIIAIGFIIIVATLLLKKFYPHAVLLIAGLAMLIISMAMNFKMPTVIDNTGWSGFDLFRLIKESFSKTNAGVGLMIMAIGGFVAYIDKIGASDALVRIAMRPLSLFKKYPYIATTAVLPIGQLLFVCIPSAAGLGLLLMASIFPILLGLGVSRLTAVSTITACTAFGIGPASAITARAVNIAGVDSISYFVKDQLPVVLLLCIVLMVTYYFVNRYYDKKEATPIKVKADLLAEQEKNKEERIKAPNYYAIIPVLPLVLLIVFSEIFQLTPVPITLDTTTAMFISLFIALIFEFIRKRNLKEVLASLSTFWNGMGNIFKTVVTLIIAADIFAKGLISLGFIDGLISSSQNIGLGAIGISLVMVVMIFLASMLMGSGNASFFAFAPLVPKIAAQFGIKTTSMILPMNLAASMGRTVSPVAGVLIATSEIAGVSPLAIVKRNFIPLVVALVFLLIYPLI